MATGLQAFARGQIGKEVTPGTAVAATRVLLYETLEISGDYMEFAEPVEERNSLALVHRSTPIHQAPITLALDGELLFQDIVLWLGGAVIAGPTPTQPDPAVDLYTFTPNYTAVNSPTSYTIEAGDNEQEIEVPYTIVESIELSFAADEAARCKVNMLGQRRVDSTFTGALSAPTVETAKGALVEMYVDPAWSGIGSTQVFDGELVEGNIKIMSGLQFVKRSDGTLYVTKAVENKRRLIEAEFTVEHDAVSKAYHALYEANTKRFIEMRFVGSEIATSFDHFLKVQWGGPFRSFEYDNDGGVRTVKIRSVSEYDATGAAEAKFLVQNALNSVTEFG